MLSYDPLDLDPDVHVCTSLQENDSVEYAAVYFSNKRLKTARRHNKDPTAVYTDIA